MTSVSPHRPTRIARQQAALSRLSATADTTRSLEELLARVPDGEQRPVDPDGLLLSAARALLGLVQRSAGSELLVSLGPDHAWAVRVFHDGNGPSVELTPARRPEPAPAVRPHPPVPRHVPSPTPGPVTAVPTARLPGPSPVAAVLAPPPVATQAPTGPDATSEAAVAAELAALLRTRRAHA